ncbi:thioredoxin family protein [Thiomicrospira microaerophila]|uniref:thioredoxin family protein n=1 Tax=Thiomicrospira microaerophila TaxID=406020 RepID=UPI00200C5639|nr:thioredoxin family protein [Thiomicrospira microaerophila]UQB41453.1 thioredoxin family protein [Thiomicrospira microaerophila]
MQQVENLEVLEQLIETQPGLVVLFGGEHCGVCQIIKPKLMQALADGFAQLELVYIDCQKHTKICSQKGVFSLPVVQVYIDGQRFIEKARTFSLPGLLAEMSRPYQLRFES